MNGDETTIENISDLEEKIEHLKDNDNFILNIQIASASDILRTFEKYKISFERIKYKRWRIYKKDNVSALDKPDSCSSNVESSTGFKNDLPKNIKNFRLLCLISTIVLATTFIYFLFIFLGAGKSLMNSWAYLENQVGGWVVLAGIVSMGITAIFTLIFRRFSKALKGVPGFIKLYLEG